MGWGRRICGRICSSVEARLYDDDERLRECDSKDMSGRPLCPCPLLCPSSVLVRPSRFGTAGGPMAALSSSSLVIVEMMEDGRPLVC